MKQIHHFYNSLPSESTKKAYRFSLQRFEKYLEGSGGDLLALTRVDVQSYVSWLQTVGKKTPATVCREYASIASFCRWSNQEKACDGIRLPKQQRVTEIAPKALDRTDRNRLLRDIEKAGNARNIAIVYALMYTGLRVGELCALDRDDVVLGDRTETSRLTVRDGKGGKARVVPLPVEARRYLKEYLATRSDAHEALFVTEKRAVARLSVRAVQALLKQYNVHPHLLRHTLGKTLADAGKSLPVIGELLGHNDINTTRRYTKATLKDIADAMDDLYL